MSARERARQALRAAREALAKAEADYLYACGWTTKRDARSTLDGTAGLSDAWHWHPPHGTRAPIPYSGTDAPLAGPVHVTLALQLAEAQP